MRVMPLVLVMMMIAAGCRTASDLEAYDLKEERRKPMNLEELQAEGADQENWSPLNRQSNGSYYFMMAEYKAMSGGVAEAMELYQAAYNLDPNPFLAWKMIAAEAAAGKMDEALISAKKMSLLYPKNAELQVMYGQLLAQRGLEEEAIKYFETAIDLAPRKLEAYLGLIQIYQSKQKYNEALVIAKDLVKADPSYADGWAVLAKLYLATNQKKAALGPAQMAYELQSNDPEKVLVYAICLELNGNSKSAVHLYEIVFRINPTNEELIARMVDLYRQLGDLRVALNLIQDAMAQQEKPGPGIRMQYAFILWELKEYDKAAKVLMELSREYPESDRLQYMAALGQERLEAYGEALRLFQAVEESSPYKIHAQYRSVVIYRQMKKYDEAMRVVEEALAKGGERSDDFYGVGASIQSEKGDNEAALAMIDRGIAKYPDNAQMYFMRGVYLEKLKRIKETVAAMRKTIDLDRNHSSAYNFLGYLFVERDENLDEAETLIKRALEIKPNDGYYMDSLGWLYFKKKQYPKALETLKKADALAPKEGVIIEHVADVYLAMGKRNEARENYQRALQARLEDNDKERITKKLAEITGGK